MADRGLVSAPNAAAGMPFNIGGQPTGFYPLGPETGLPTQSTATPAPEPTPPPGYSQEVGRALPLPGENPGYPPLPGSYQAE